MTTSTGHAEKKREQPSQDEFLLGERHPVDIAAAAVRLPFLRLLPMHATAFRGKAVVIKDVTLACYCLKCFKALLIADDNPRSPPSVPGGWAETSVYTLGYQKGQ